LLNKHREILLSQNWFDESGIQMGEFDLFITNGGQEGTELTCTNWLHILESNPTTALEIILQQRQTQNLPTPAQPTDGSNVNGLQDPDHPANPIESAQAHDASPKRMSGGFNDYGTPSLRARESFEGIPDAPKHGDVKLIPFFQWRLRKDSERIEEQTRSGRTEIVLNWITQSKLFDTYQELLYDKDRTKEPRHAGSLKELLRLKGIAIEQYRKNIGDIRSQHALGTTTRTQIDTLMRATEEMLELFVPGVFSATEEIGFNGLTKKEPTIRFANSRASEKANLMPAADSLDDGANTEPKDTNRDPIVSSKKAHRSISAFDQMTANTGHEPRHSTMTEGLTPQSIPNSTDQEQQSRAEGAIPMVMKNPELTLSSHELLQKLRAILANMLMVSQPCRALWVDQLKLF
jgi:hypothetical protein